jgi:hypothetical protein
MSLQRQASLLLAQDAHDEALETLDRIAAKHADVAASSLAALTVDGIRRNDAGFEAVHVITGR